MNKMNLQEFIQSYLDSCDKNYINDLLKNDLLIEKKIEEMDLFIEKIKDKPLISIEEYNQIKKYSISKGGFLTNKNRKILYTKIYNITQDNYSNYIYLDPLKEPKLLDGFKLEIFRKKDELTDLIQNPPESKVILQDCNRSKIYKMLSEYSPNNNNIEEIVKTIKKELFNYISEMAKLNNSLYGYFQGYHDIGLYFYLLYYNNYQFAKSVFQRFSEFNLKESLDINPNIKDSYQFLSCLEILKFVINKLDKKIQNFLNEIIENGICHFAVSWILSIFTHNIDNPGIMYRILDYIIMSHPLSIYYLTSLIIIDTIYQADSKLIETGPDLFKYFQDITLEKINYDKYVQLCNDKIENLNISDFKELFSKLYVKKFYPIMSEIPCQEKWIMRQNNLTYNNFFWYIKRQYNAFKSLFK